MPGASKKEEETEDYGYDLDTTGESGAINEGGEQAEFGMWMIIENIDDIGDFYECATVIYLLSNFIVA